MFIKADGLSGKRLEYILEADFGIEVESASDEGILILCNIGNKRSDFEYLVKCLKKIDESKYQDIYYLENKKHMPMLTPIIKKSLRDAYFSEKEIIPKHNVKPLFDLKKKIKDEIAILTEQILSIKPDFNYKKDTAFFENKIKKSSLKYLLIQDIG